jgi:hypothetical protein
VVDLTEAARRWRARLLLACQDLHALAQRVAVARAYVIVLAQQSQASWCQMEQ